jgi:tRNA (cmo5U34)-methyltransferase
MNTKSSVDEIRQRFDNDVERFSNLETGQAATIDAPLALDLIASAAAAVNPQATELLDVGCGAGNYTLKLLQRLPNLNVTLVDLSRPMLDRAQQRIRAVSSNRITTHQSDIRELQLGEHHFDIIVAAAVLHHLRTDDEWISTFNKFHCALRTGGSIWIFDMIEHTEPAVRAMMWSRYGEYLTNLKDANYRDTVFTYIEKEDTPQPLMYQLNLLQKAGFRTVEVLHKNAVFAAFGAIK